MGTEGWTQYSEASTNFVGYELSACETKVVRWREDKGVLSIVLETSPFYAEMGGQVGDKGTLVSADLEIQVFDTVKVNDTALCRGKVVKGEANEKTMGAVFMATATPQRTCSRPLSAKCLALTCSSRVASFRTNSSASTSATSSRVASFRTNSSALTSATSTP